jgi:hypothetical protein
LLLEHKTRSSLEKLGATEKPFDDIYEIYERVEEVKMLSDNVNEPLLDLEKCSLNEIINILQIIFLSVFIKPNLDLI